MPLDSSRPQKHTFKLQFVRNNEDTLILYPFSFLRRVRAGEGGGAVANSSSRSPGGMLSGVFGTCYERRAIKAYMYGVVRSCFGFESEHLLGSICGLGMTSMDE